MKTVGAGFLQNEIKMQRKKKKQVLLRTYSLVELFILNIHSISGKDFQNLKAQAFLLLLLFSFHISKKLLF